MAILKCKKCGNVIMTTEDYVTICRFCGSTETLPDYKKESVNPDSKINLHNKANTFRFNKEYEKAYVVYETILKEDIEDYEAYWGIVLCKYGVYYVDNQETQLKKVSCHKTRNESILDDLDYLKVLRYCPLEIKDIYEKEALEIDKVQTERRNIGYENTYSEAMKYYETKQYMKALEFFSKIENYKDSLEKKIECEKIVSDKLETLYQIANQRIQDNNLTDAIEILKTLGSYKDSSELLIKYTEESRNNKKYLEAIELSNKKTISGYARALEILTYIEDYKDSADLMTQYKNEIKKINQKKEEKTEKIVKGVRIGAIVLAVLLALFLIIYLFIIPSLKLDKAKSHISNGEYEEAIEIIEGLGNFGDAEDLRLILGTIKKFNKRDYLEGIEDIKSIGGEVTFEYDTKGGKLIEEEGINSCELIGYDFVGWDFEDYTLDIKNNYKMSVKLSAVFNMTYYNIYYDPHGAIMTNIKTMYTYFDEVAIPNVEKIGYTFIGWYDGKETKKDYVISKYSQEDITLEAIFAQNVYKVYFNTDGGIIDELSREVLYGSQVNLPTPEKAGYTFVGWYNGDKKTVSQKWYYPHDVYLEAKYVKNYYITYDLDGGESNNLETVFNDVQSIYLSNPTKEGYSFIGWFDENGNEVTELELKDYTLKAKWFKGKIEGNIMYFGNFPQGMLRDYTIKSVLSNKDVNELGYIEYKDVVYRKYGDDFYIAEPIKWRILSKTNGIYKLVSDAVLDYISYARPIGDRETADGIIYQNNYKYSNIRAYLNGLDLSSYNVASYQGKGFYDIAFNEYEKSIMNEMNVDNSSESTMYPDNPYACENTIDKVTLLSQKEITDYYPVEKRNAYLTTYAYQRGTHDTLYWLRSPYGNVKNRAMYVEKNGAIYSSVTHDSYIGIRPVIEVVVYETDS